MFRADLDFEESLEVKGGEGAHSKSAGSVKQEILCSKDKTHHPAGLSGTPRPGVKPALLPWPRPPVALEAVHTATSKNIETFDIVWPPARCQRSCCRLCGVAVPALRVAGELERRWGPSPTRKASPARVAQRRTPQCRSVDARRLRWHAARQRYDFGLAPAGSERGSMVGSA